MVYTIKMAVYIIPILLHQFPTCLLVVFTDYVLVLCKLNISFFRGIARIGALVLVAHNMLLRM